MIDARVVRRFPAGRESSAFHLDVHMTAGQGVTALFGPSGSGKTLLLDCIAGFARPDEGRILLDDDIVYDRSSQVFVEPQRRRCGYVFQNYALFPHMTLRQNLMFAAAAVPRLERQRRVNELLETFRLDPVAGRKPHELSGGQKQRGSIARALAATPRVLLLDEPSRGLDAPLKMELYAILRQVRSEFQMPMVLVTHDLRECFELGDSMYVLREGRLVQSGAPTDIAARPANVELARLLGVFNIVPVEIRSLDPSRNSSVLRLGDFDLQGEYYPGHLKGDRVHVLVSPRELRALPRNGRPGPNQVPVQLQRIVESADFVRLEFVEGLEFPMRGLRVL